MKMIVRNRLLLGILGALLTSTVTGRAAEAGIYQALVTREFGTALDELAAVEKEIKNASKDQYAEIEARLIAVLEAPGATMAGKQFACQMLHIVGSSKCVSPVSKLLTDKELSHMARVVLLGMHSPAVESSLRQALQQTQGTLRLGIINTIGDRRDRSSVQALAALLAGQDDATAGAALNAIGKIGGVEAADALAAAKVPDTLKLAWGDASLRCAASLAAVDSARAGKMLHSLFDGNFPISVRAGAFTAIARLEKEQAVPLIVKTLTSSDAMLRRVALGALINVPGNAVTKALANAAAGLDPQAKAVLLAGLASRGDAEGLTPMVNTLAGDENATVREAAMKALARLGDASSVAVLTAALKDQQLNSAAREALVSLQGPGIPEALIQQAQSGDARARADMLNVLSERRQAEALPMVRKLTQDEDTSIRRAALKTLAVLGTQEDMATLANLVLSRKDGAEGDLIVQAMSDVGGRVNDKTARVEPVLAAWSKADAATQVRLVSVLWTLGGDKALETVRGSLQGEAALRKAAVKALAEWQDPAPMPDLLTIAKTDPDPSSRILALRGYIKMAGQPGLRTAQRNEAYKTALELATRPDEKKLALTGLADVAHPDALRMAEACLDDPALQREAYVACEKIAESLASRQPALAKPALLRVSENATDQNLRDKAKRALDKIK